MCCGIPKTTMQDLRVWNNNGTVWIHCKYNDVRHSKKEESVYVDSLLSHTGKRLWTVLS